MKVLITDDEYHVIQAIRLLVPWEELGVDKILTASSGTQALELICQEVPEIVITDIVMEDKNGIEIMDFIASRYPSTKVIAVSGYGEFEYVRAMLTKGCLDYLLKPLEPSKLIRTVRSAIQSRNRDHESKLRIHTLSAFYSASLLYKMLDPAKEETVYQQLLRENPSFSAIFSHKIIYYDTNWFPMNHSPFSGLMKGWEQRVRQLLLPDNGIMLSNPERAGETILFLYGSTERTLLSIAQESRSLFFNTPFPFHLGVSVQLPFPDQFRFAYAQAKNSFLNVYADTRPSMIATLDQPLTPSAPSDSSSALQEREDPIFSALLTGNQAEIERCAEDWIVSVLPEKNITLQPIDSAIKRFYRLLNHWIFSIKKKNPSFSWDINECPLVYADMMDEHFLFSRRLMSKAICSTLFSISARMKHNSSTDVMHQIALYMESNYSKPFIQSEYASLFYMNKDYMSRRFTSTFHVSMLTYLNQIRIRHAKELLEDFSLKIQDIAYAIGFKDEKYFAKQFKKLTGATPGDYRATLQREQKKT